MIEQFIREVLAEDVGRGDLYARVSAAVDASAKIIAKSDGVFAGEEYLRVLSHIEGFVIVWHKHDGERFIKGEVLLELSGDSHTLLRIERTLLNMLLHASSIATLTRKYVDLIAPYGTKLLDTRKTRPLLRNFEKYATRIGGATNHRMGLDDALMLKDTHLKTIDNLESFMESARQKIPFTSKIEIEAEDFEMAKKAMKVGADIVMCDNMSPKQLREVVEYKGEHHSSILLEASGNITLETIEEYAKTGVDAISTGSLIHQALWIDLSMKMD
jgi:nicotinate-nucleotide pyrophosphorylase (carboxylating)